MWSEEDVCGVPNGEGEGEDDPDEDRQSCCMCPGHGVD